MQLFVEELLAAELPVSGDGRRYRPERDAREPAQVAARRAARPDAAGVRGRQCERRGGQRDHRRPECAQFHEHRAGPCLLE